MLRGRPFRPLSCKKTVHRVETLCFVRAGFQPDKPANSGNPAAPTNPYPREPARPVDPSPAEVLNPLKPQLR